ncbi:MAG: tryptophan synthase subunit alpha [Candidatus Omnitrophica bacterium]|nr:tryptophan synthase subunit alpha [Candidatus Omnitrophota bacterium]
MNRIDETFARLHRQRRKALIGYLTVGYPTPAMLPRLATACAEGGLDLLELGMAQGETPARTLRQVRELRRRGLALPIVLMTYYNPVLRYGVRRFCADTAGSGADGIIVPDLPPEEAAELRAGARRAGLDVIFLAAPTSSRERLRRIARASSGFIYYVSLTGVTGARSRLPQELGGHVRALRRMTRLPVCVGFGVSRPEQVRALARFADGVIVGSALLDRIGKAGAGAPARAREFVRRLRKACP